MKFKHQSEKYSKIQTNHLQTKFAAIITWYPTFKRIKKSYSFKQLFRRKWTFLGELDLSEVTD